MDHEMIKSKLEAYYDHELPPTEATEVADHLSRCLSCRERLQELEKIRDVFFKAPLVEPSEARVLRIMERVLEPDEESLSIWALIRYFVPTAACMGAALFLMSFLPMGGDGLFYEESEMINQGGSPMAVAGIPVFDNTVGRDWTGLENL